MKGISLGWGRVSIASLIAPLVLLVGGATVATSNEASAQVGAVYGSYLLDSYYLTEQGFLFASESFLNNPNNVNAYGSWAFSYYAYVSYYYQLYYIYVEPVKVWADAWGDYGRTYSYEAYQYALPLSQNPDIVDQARAIDAFYYIEQGGLASYYYSIGL